MKLMGNRSLAYVRLAVVLSIALVLFGASVSALGFGRHNDNGSRKEKSEQRRKLMEQRSSYSEWDAEASTGTVREVKTPEEKAHEAASQTCDGQMALSLVKANEEKQDALEERDDALSKMKVASQQAESLEQELISTRSTLLARIADLEDKLNMKQKVEDERVAEVKEQAERQVKDAKSKADLIVSEINASMEELAAKQADELEEMATAAQRQVATAEAKAEETVSEVKTAMEESLAEKEKEVLSLRQAVGDQKVTLQTELDEKVAAAERERDDAVAEVKKMMIENERLAGEKLEQMKESHTVKMQTMTEKLSEYQLAEEGWLKEKKDLENKFAQAAEDLSRWEGVFSNRSYCNLTHIGEDAAFAAWVASLQASEKISSVASQTVEAARQLQDRTLKSAAPHIETGKKLGGKLYGDYIEKHVETLRPHYNQYAAPVVEKAAIMGSEYHAKYAVPAIAEADRQARETAKQGERLLRERFDSLVAKFNEECPNALAALKISSKERGINLPTFLVENWAASCRQPRETVATGLKALATLFAIIFRRRICRFIRWFIVLPFAIIWYFFPFRWFFGRKNNPSPVPQNGPSSEVSNGKVSRCV